MKKILVTLMTIVPSILHGQEIKISRLGDNMSNISTTVEASVKAIKLRNTKASDMFGVIHSPKALLSFNDDTSGIRVTYDIGLGMLATDSVSQVYPITMISANLPHKWNSANPFSVGVNIGYAPLDDIARFARANVGVGSISGNSEVFLKQRMWLRLNQDYRMITDSNRRLASTMNARYFSGKGIIYGAQFYRQSFKFDANLNEISGYWSPRTYTSETVELGYKRPWNSKITGQIIISTGYQQINNDNSVIGSIQADARFGPFNAWGNYSSNGAISGMTGYRWWTIGSSLKF